VTGIERRAITNTHRRVVSQRGEVPAHFRATIQAATSVRAQFAEVSAEAPKMYWKVTFKSEALKTWKANGQQRTRRPYISCTTQLRSWPHHGRIARPFRRSKKVAVPSAGPHMIRVPSEGERPFALGHAYELGLKAFLCGGDVLPPHASPRET
jgi:hypothetical protein